MAYGLTGWSGLYVMLLVGEVDSSAYVTVMVHTMVEFHAKERQSSGRHVTQIHAQVYLLVYINLSEKIQSLKHE